MEESEAAPTPKTTLIWRGIRGRCPHCGEGALFKSYLQQNDVCPVCAEDFSHIRADDGPAWLTILLTLHIVVPTAIIFATHDFFPEWVDATLLLILTILTALLILPRTKGLFIAVLWMLARKRATAQPSA